ncbi:MAG: aminotransferase class I/II-fold pyridoxal phosphate-dependent enzyme, partial [Planctomycetota bacterium]
HHHGEHVSIARFYPEGTIISSGLSKWCGAGGWRLGTFAFPQRLTWLMDAMAAAASETYSSVCAPVQYAAVRAFEGSMEIERYLWHARRVLRAIAERIVPPLAGAQIAVMPPVGAFYLFLDFSDHADTLHERGITSGAALCARLLEDTGAALLPGSAFGRPRGELTARLAYVDFDGAAALAASETIGLSDPLPTSFLEKCCGNVVKGAERIAGWARKLQTK